MKISPKLGQSILGFVFAFIIIAAMAVGLTRVWVWFNVNYGVRQVRYQESRTAATAKWGSSGSGNAYLSQQINRELYKSLDLDDEWLFKGKATTEVPYILPDIVSPISAAALCANQCPECVQKRIPEGCDCTADGCECISNPNCVCFMQCMCRASIQLRLDAYDLNIQSLKETAAGMRQEARKLEKKAEECDDPWEFCWWGGFGVPAKKLKQAAGKLRGQAEGLCCGWCDHCGCSGKTCPECEGCVPNSKAALLAWQKSELEACCRTETKTEMELCFMDIAARQCPAIRDANVAFWDEAIRVIQGDINLTTAIRDRIPGEQNNYCPKWALLRCKYTDCRPGAELFCQQECESYGHTECTTRCDTDCTAECTYADPVPPGDPPGIPYLHEDCYAPCMFDCLNLHCNHVCPGCDWYEEFYNYCMTNTYPICVQDKINACGNAEC
ncbi:MAG: hypothetical protein FJZ10_05295, partial [Candidatus Omnitrophica bacterium]|nr:hypothetical protein [Candidatus Omnitrophota bacterium]